MLINILICTFNNGIENIIQLLPEPEPKIRYIISHQYTDPFFSKIPSLLKKREDVEIFQLYGSGLSKNRNNCIQHAKGDICFIADDDVQYDTNAIHRIIDYFEIHPDVDLITGQIKTYEGEPAYKQYPPKAHSVKIKDIGKISSVEIAFRRSSIQNNGIFFDTRFGIKGSLFPQGEEAVFLSDCIKAGLKIEYLPIELVSHHYESTLRNDVYSNDKANYVGALSKRIFGNLFILASLFFTVKYYKRYSKTISMWSFLRSYFRGAKMIHYN